MANIYAPNTDDHNFFLILSSLPGVCVAAGDFNCAFDPVKDRSSGAADSHIRSRATLQYFMKELNLKDVWREEYPDDLSFLVILGYTSLIQELTFTWFLQN